MKAEKRIQIQMHECCDSFFEEFYNKTNIISVTSEQLEEIRIKCNELIKEDYSFNFVPFIKNGYFDVEINGIHQAYLFECSENETGKIHIVVEVINDINTKEKTIIAGKEYKNTIFVCRIESEIPDGNIRDLNVNESTVYDYYYLSRELTDYNSFIPAKFKSLLQEVESLYFLLLYVFGYINYLSEFPEYKVVNGKEKRKYNNSASSTIKKESKKTNISNDIKTVNLNGLKIVVKDKKVISRLKSRTPHKYVGTWNVCGHYRHYKSGKTIYIKPYTKGSGDQSIEKAKKYMLNVWIEDVEYVRGND